MEEAIDFKLNEKENVNAKFDEFLEQSITSWAELTYKKIKREIEKTKSQDSILGKTITQKHYVKDFSCRNKKLGDAFREYEIERRDAGMNMYWNGNLKLSFTPKIVYYSKNTSCVKNYFLEISLSNVIKSFVDKLDYLCRDDGLDFKVIADVFDGSGLKHSFDFDTLDKKLKFYTDCDYVLKVNSFYISYQIKI